MKKNEQIFIEDVLKDKYKSEEKIQKIVEDELEKLEKENKSRNELYDPNKKEYDTCLDKISSSISKAGQLASSGGLMAIGGTVIIGISLETMGIGILDTILLGIMYTSMGVFGIGLIPLLGVGAYSLFKKNKYGKIQEFYKDFDNNNMKVEREIRQHVITKMFNYFMKPISNNYNEIKIKKTIDDINNNINVIINIFISIDNSKLELSIASIKKSDYFSCEQKNLLDNLNKFRKLVVRNYIKISQELVKTLLISTTSEIDKSFDEGVPLFKELIKSFGPQRIDNENESKVDDYLEIIIKSMKEILLKEINGSFTEFKPNIFKNSFKNYLKEKYLEKKQQEEFLDEKDFTDRCNECIIDFISEKSKNWGIISFYIFFANIIIKTCMNSKENNYKKMTEK